MAAQRPFYLIAHQSNDTSDIGNSLSVGANGIECDVHFSNLDSGGYQWWVYHDDITMALT